METNEIMTNEEVVEAAEEIVPASSENGIGVGIAIGSAVVLVGVLTAKYIVKPLVAKIKDKKNEQRDSDESDLIVVEDED